MPVAVDKESSESLFFLRHQVMENKLPLSKPLMLVILGVIFAIAIGGYVLFFQSQKRITQKDHEYDLLKTKVTQMEEGYTDTQKKYDDAVEKNKQLTKDLQDATKSGLDLKTKSDELQAKYEELLINQEKLTKELKDKASGQTAPATPAAAEPKSSSAHPIQELSPQNNSTGTSDPAVPSVSITPPTEPPPPPPEKKASLTQPSASSAGVTLGGQDLHCPTSETVTKNLASGNWTEGNLNWWVDYTRRPINENEPVQTLFQILFDGQTIACYYELTKGDQDAWIVIKGSSKNDKLVLKEADGWSPCPTKECEATCAKEKLNQCHFSLQKL